MRKDHFLIPQDNSDQVICVVCEVCAYEFYLPLVILLCFLSVLFLFFILEYMFCLFPFPSATHCLLKIKSAVLLGLLLFPHVLMVLRLVLFTVFADLICHGPCLSFC